MITMQTVHTAGVNFVSVGTLIISFVVAICGAAGFILKRLDRNRDKTETFVTGQVSQVSLALSGRLDRIDRHLADQDRSVAQQNERLARVEGRLLVTPQDPPGH
jgi:hypothetical protein